MVLILFGAFFGGLFVGNLYKVANKGESVNALSNEDDYPIFDGKDVYEYWRGTLNEDEQILYDEIKEAYLQFKKEFTTRLNSLTESQMRKVYLLVKLDHPEIFLGKYLLNRSDFFRKCRHIFRNSIILYLF